MKTMYILECIIYFICISLIIYKIFNQKTTTTKHLINFAIHCGILVFLCYIDDAIFIPLQILYPICSTLAFCYAYKKVSIFSIVYTYTFIYCINTLMTLLISIISHINFKNALWIEFFVILLIGIICIIACVTKIKIKIQQIKNWTPASAKKLLLILLFLSIVLLALVFDETYFSNSDAWFKLTQKVALLVVILLLITISILVFIMLSNNHLKQLTANYEQQIVAQAEHYKLLAESTFELRRFKHDFKNMSIAMEKLLNDEEHSEALQLFKQYNNTLENPTGHSVMYDTGNGIADALLADKQTHALSCNCNIVFQGAIPSNHLLPTDICVILGNTLDNAIEACEKLQTRETLTINVTCNCNSGFMFLSITNPILERVNIRNNHITTTKENKTLHGFGLYSLHSVVKKYDGNIELKSTDSSFTVSIDLSLMQQPTPVLHNMISDKKQAGSQI